MRVALAAICSSEEGHAACSDEPDQLSRPRRALWLRDPHRALSAPAFASSANAREILDSAVD